MSELNRVTPIGSGLLGGQNSWHSAFKGKTVTVYDIAREALDGCRATHGEYATIYASELANADYLKNNFIDHGWLGRQTGKGYYDYPDPAFARPDFLDVPDISVVGQIVSLLSPQ